MLKYDTNAFQNLTLKESQKINGGWGPLKVIVSVIITTAAVYRAIHTFRCNC